ncbi:MAG TPA: TSUP family transporter [Kofleriaceae bacterium]|jgi:hypothetical protein
MSVFTIALLAVAAFGAGTVDAIAGGGGLITVPALLAAGLPPHVVLATNKGQSTWGSLASMIAYWRAGRVDRVQARLAFPLGFVGAAIGTSLVLRVPADVLKPIVIALLVGAAVLLLIKKPSREADAPRRRWAIVGALALVIGAYDGFFGPGTGTFLIVGFVALCGRSLVHASADAKVVNFAANLAALLVFAHRGLVVWEVSLPMAVGQVLGGTLGARLAVKGGARIVRVAVLVVSGALVAKLLVDLLRA